MEKAGAGAVLALGTRPKANQPPKPGDNIKPEDKCMGCGFEKHREKHCPAWEKLCNCCKKQQHFFNVYKMPWRKDKTKGIVAAAAETPPPA